MHRLDDLRPAGYVAFHGWNDLFDQYIAWDRRRPQLLGFNSTFFLIQDRLYELHQKSWKSWISWNNWRHWGHTYGSWTGKRAVAYQDVIVASRPRGDPPRSHGPA